MRKSKLFSNVILYFVQNCKHIIKWNLVLRDVNKSHFTTLGLEIAIKTLKKLTRVCFTELFGYDLLHKI